MMRFRCPKCGSHIAHDADKGAIVECPNCKTSFDVPHYDQAVDSVPAEPSIATVDPASPSAWQFECERLTYFAGSLLRLAKRVPASSGIIDVIRSAPHSEEAWREFEIHFVALQTNDAQYSTHPSLFVRTSIDAYFYNKDRSGLLGSAMQYWQEFVRMPSARRDVLEACVIGTAIGYATT